MLSSSRTKPVRVAVLVDSPAVPAWVEWTIAQIAATDGLELAAVVPAAGARDLRAAAGKAPRRHQATYRLYEWVDARVFGPSRAMDAADLSPILRGAMPADVGPIDVVVSFVPADRTFWDGPAPRHGIWAIVPMDDGRPAQAPIRFWELRGNMTASTTVVALDGGGARTIAEDSVPADRLSLARTRNAAAWASARLVLRSLRSLHRDGGPAAPDDSLADPRDVPSATITVTQAARVAIQGATAKSLSAWRRGEWFVAVRRRSANGGPQEPFCALQNPAGRDLADPFPIVVDGRHFMFVEDYSHAAGRAAISVSEPGPDGRWSPPRKVLEREHHLAYPFVFEHGGAIYMLLGSRDERRVELYRAVKFPDEWQLDRVLLEGLAAVDVTLHADADMLWLFAHIVAGDGDAGELWLFSSRSLDGEWRPHPRNPIVTDPGTARPAGRLFKRAGTLIRPSQDCSRRYGEAVVLNRVDTLSVDDYRETPVERIDPDWMAGIEGTHTYTFDREYEFLDGYRYVPRLEIKPLGRSVASSPRAQAVPLQAVGLISILAYSQA
jgi:hypothetical protein